MKLHYSPKNNPRVIVIQKIYSKTFNKEEKITFEKHRFKKFIKDIVLGTLERDEVLYEDCLLYTSPSPRDMRRSRMPSSA